MSLACPRDGASLIWLSNAGYHFCQRCRGLLLPLVMVPELTPWLPEIRRAVATWPRSQLGCPSCQRTMHRVVHEGVEVEICCHCDLVWLDHLEIGLIRPRPQDQAKAQIREEIKATVSDSAAQGLADFDLLGQDLGNIDLSGVLDWLGEALGQIVN